MFVCCSCKYIDQNLIYLYSFITQDDRIYFPNDSSRYFITNGFLQTLLNLKSQPTAFTKCMCDETFYDDMRTLHFTGRNKDVPENLLIPVPVQQSFRGICNKYSHINHID